MLEENWNYIFDNAYETTRASLQYKVETLGTTKESLESELEHLYIYQGHCADGRSESKEREIEGTVHAYEIYIKELSQ
ncbi:MAG: hypothetical protein PF447_06455 [Spirochaetaceae bacterium]|jgi:hypothetical protein|nr:hypothetical protein [Spirochaetaceae bacterium]